MLGKKQNIPIISHYDKSSAIKLAKNLVMSGCKKHISVHFYFLCELTKARNVEMVHCNNQNQVVDVMTKPQAGCILETMKSSRCLSKTMYKLTVSCNQFKGRIVGLLLKL